MHITPVFIHSIIYVVINDMTCHDINYQNINKK